MLDSELVKSIEIIAGETSSPLCVAFSGGGDSTALLRLALEYAQNRPVMALIVDHGLRRDSSKEASLAVGRAKKMGAKAKILKWGGIKPNTAIQEKARNARYELLGQACRQMKASQLWLGHNQDDQAETLWMRAEKQSGWRGLAGMSPRSQSPIWPQLYNVQIIRPLLNVSREDLRKYNNNNSLPYIDDPSNENTKFGRIKARQALASMPSVKKRLVDIASQSQKYLSQEKTQIRKFIKRHTKAHEWGAVSLERLAVTNTEDERLAQCLKYLILAVAGNGQAPKLEKLQNLATLMKSAKFKGATLGGARFVCTDNNIVAVRDAGMLLGRADVPKTMPLLIKQNTPTVWDGRFLLECKRPNVNAAPLSAYQPQLSGGEKNRLKSIPHYARAGLPAFVKNGELIGSFVRRPSDEWRIECLLAARLEGLLR